MYLPIIREAVLLLPIILSKDVGETQGAKASASVRNAVKIYKF